TFKRGLDHLVELRVLAPTTESKWASPSFVIPKKDGCICWISDLCQLNKVIKVNNTCCPGYKFFTKLDISIQYYTFELDESSQDFCTIITPLGKYKYLRLPMGLMCSPDISQSIMESVLAGIDDGEVYLDDVGAFSQTWEHHIKLLGNILCRLR
ncbi:hypothetical protein ACHAW6_002359, partial [Cyclotella cf. meneghiniana]